MCSLQSRGEVCGVEHNGAADYCPRSLQPVLFLAMNCSRRADVSDWVQTRRTRFHDTTPYKWAGGTHWPSTDADLLASCALRHATSQWCEDVLLLPTLLRAAPAGGTFVELGALDGRLFSNTYMLETCFGWRGLLVEPNPANFAALQASGRRATLVHSGVCSAGSTIRMSVSGGAMAANVDHMSRRHRSMHRHQPTVSVPCEPLSSIMSRTGHPNATLLSLDVEGAEDLVLGTVSPSAFQVIVVESDGFDRSKEQRVHSIITAAGLQLQDTANGLQVPRSRVYLQPTVHPVPLRNVSIEEKAMYPRPTLKELGRAMRSTY